MRSDAPEPLKLIALDQEDLKILSAHLQDAVLRMSDMCYRPSEQRFAAILSRFDWLSAEEGTGGDQSNLRRCKCVLRFDRVRRAQIHKVRPGQPFEVAELLAVTYEEVEPPSGHVTLYFAGGGAIRLEVECIEAELSDLGTSWRTALKPAHSIVEAEASPSPVAASFFQKTE
ncbi:MAG TPA: DUF2948 family protein [Hyphomicrobiales bacterium]|nr:DUF2948 family protein [Hyphomicrobiales bacterium]